jgi:hypothetical protein
MLPQDQLFFVPAITLPIYFILLYGGYGVNHVRRDSPLF